MARPVEFKIYQRLDGDWAWRLVAGNSEIVAGGEGYTRRADALRGARDMAKNVFAAMAKLVREEGAQ